MTVHDALAVAIPLFAMFGLGFWMGWSHGARHERDRILLAVAAAEGYSQIAAGTFDAIMHRIGEADDGGKGE